MPGLSFFSSKECEWADMQVLFSGAPLVKIRGLQYKMMQDKAPLHAQGNKPYSIQKGNKSFEGEIKVLKGALDDMNRAAIAAGGDGALDMEFDLVVTYLPKGGRQIQIDTLQNVQIKEFQKGWDQGAKEMECTLPILFLDLKSV